MKEKSSQSGIDERWPDCARQASRTITKLCELGFSSRFVDNLNEIIDAIEETYDMRRAASEGVLDALNSSVTVGEEDRASAPFWQ